MPCIKDYIYLAGIVDGEGCICIEKQNRRKRGEYSLQLSIVNTSEELIDWLIKTFDGYKSERKKIKNSKVIFSWRAKGEDVKNILKKTYPYLKIKIKQTEIALEYLETKQKPPAGIRLSDEIMKLREGWYRWMKFLNHKGDKRFSLSAINPCIKVKAGYRIKRGNKPGTYPKVYGSLKSCQKRVKQMERHREKPAFPKKWA